MITIDKNDVKGITLLSYGQAVRLPRWILADGNWWWLRSPGLNQNDVAGVNYGGFVGKGGYYIDDNNDVWVRPALTIKKLPNLEIGDLVEVFNRKAQYIRSSMVLLCEPIDHRKFDKETNNYGKSEIKEFLEGWLSGEKSKC